MSRQPVATLGASVFPFAMRIACYALMTAPPSASQLAATARSGIRACLAIAVPCASLSDMLGQHPGARPQTLPGQGDWRTGMRTQSWERGLSCGRAQRRVDRGKLSTQRAHDSVAAYTASSTALRSAGNAVVFAFHGHP